MTDNYSSARTVRHLLGISTALFMGAAAPAQASTFDIIVTYLDAGVSVNNDPSNPTNPVTTESFTNRQKQLFCVAETFWESVLTGFQNVVNPVFNITASLAPEDGFDGSLAYAGPLTYADVVGVEPISGTAKTFDRAISGFMQFDAEDFGASVLNPQTEKLFLDSAIHEIAHALGFGTQFDFNGLVGATDTQYIGAAALQAFNTAYKDSVFSGVEQTSIRLQPGSGHWSECWVTLDAACDEEGDFFNDLELMSPFAVDAATLSPATIAAFRDLGYETIDPFSGKMLPGVPAVTVDVPAVPLPAGMVLMISALGAFGAVARRRAVAA